jgi:D-3-phosphoglycerate dehydrogenase / 2-oxoglutarate reductase
MTRYNKPNINILITEPEYFTSESIEKMRKIGKVAAKRMERAKLLKTVRNIDVLVVRIETKVNKELILNAKKLRGVISTTTGLNHIDMEALKLRDIPVFSLHGTHSVSTAEHAIALLFSAARNIPSAHTHIIGGQWKRWKYIGTELTGKTLGILGIGRVGTEVAQRARGLKMKVIAYDPFVNKKEITKRGGQKVSWNTFLKKSDFITLHAPLTEKTRGILGKKEIEKMKHGIIIINTARGAIIKQKALLEAMRSGKIRAAAIDVYEKEPLPSSSPLHHYAKKHENLVLTPHLGASTREAVANASQFAVDALLKIKFKE